MRSRAWIDPDGEKLCAHDQTGRDPQGIDDGTINIGLDDAVLLLEMESRAGPDDRETAHATGETRGIVCRQQLDLVGTHIGACAAIWKMARLYDRAALPDVRFASRDAAGQAIDFAEELHDEARSRPVVDLTRRSHLLDSAGIE